MIDRISRSIATSQPSSMYCKKQGSHARGMSPTQHTSRMELPRLKQKEESNSTIIVKEI